MHCKVPRNTGNQDRRFLPMPETLADHVVASSSVWRMSCFLVIWRFIMSETDIKQLHGEIVLTDRLRVCVDEILEKVWVSSKSLLNAVGQEICHQAAVNSKSHNTSDLVTWLWNRWLSHFKLENTTVVLSFWYYKLLNICIQKNIFTGFAVECWSPWSIIAFKFYLILKSI